LKNIRSLYWFGMLLLFWMVALPNTQYAAASSGFSAKIIRRANSTEKDRQNADTLIVQGEWVRIESGKHGQKIIRIHRPDLKITYEIHPSQKSYNELPYTPAAHWFRWHELYKPLLKAIGRETVAGRVCEKFSAPIIAAKFWISGQFNFPLRVTMGGFFVELSDIQTTPPEKALFEPPGNYRLQFSYLKHAGATAETKGDTPSPPAPSPATPKPSGQHDNAAAFPADTAACVDDPSFYDFSLKMYTHPVDQGETKSLDQPLAVTFNHPVHPDFFSFEIRPDPGEWKSAWDTSYKRVTLHHAAPFRAGQRYVFTASVVGGPRQTAAFTAATPGPEQLLSQDLKSAVIDINQAATYRLFRHFDPAQIPMRYRSAGHAKCATHDIHRVINAFGRIDQKTRIKLLPYLLPPHNPKSFWYRKLREKKIPKGSSLSLKWVASAWAAEPFVKEVYHTDTGFKVVIQGLRSLSPIVHQARQLVEEKKIYERFEHLMGRKTLHTGDYELNIYIFHRFPDPKLDGFCDSFEYDPDDPANKYPGTHKGVPWIAISARNCNTKRLLGAVLAHEMFHAFQCAFRDYTARWIEEGTAVWAEDYICQEWNDEQSYLESAFSTERNELSELETEDQYAVYGRYLFPLYLTKVNPGLSLVMRKIWQNLEGSNDAIHAVRKASGNFDDLWKKYVLAVLDEETEQGRFPDIPNRYGHGPLKLNRLHKFKVCKIDELGNGGLAADIYPLSAVYWKIINKEAGPYAPAIRIDLSDLKKDRKISIQALIVYRDGRCQYEDWSDQDRRIFCLSHKKENFSKIYLVAACTSDTDTGKAHPVLLNIYPEIESDCDKGIAVMTLRIHGNESEDRQFLRGAGGYENRHTSWSRYATVRMQIKPWRDKIPDRAQKMLDKLPSVYPEVDANRIDTARQVFKSSMRAPRKYDDPHTGCTVLKFRVTSCNVSMSGGTYRSVGSEKRRDSMGIYHAASGNYSTTVTNVDLDSETRNRLEERQLSLNVYVDPSTKKIKWVKFPLVGVKVNIHQHNKGYSRNRYQDKRGFYHYREHDTSWQKTIDSGMQVTFDSPGPDRQGQPLDPVWRSKSQSRLSANGWGRKIRPLSHRWDTYDDSGDISGQENVEFRWKLTLQELPHGS